MLLDVWGWVCAVAGPVVSIPQVARLLRSRTSAGLSLLMWQLNIACAVAWSFHGLCADAPNIVAPNVLLGVAAVLVVRMVTADRGVPASRTWPLVATVATVLLAVEYFMTPAAFGVAVLIPAAAGLLGQSRDLIRSRDLSGVSRFFVTASAVVQAMWWLWGVGAGDQSIIVCATVMGLITTFNATWYALRTRRLVGPRARELATLP